MLPEAEDIIYVTLPGDGLQAVVVDMFFFEVVHEDVGVGWSDPSAHGSSPYLKVIFTVKLEVVV